MYRLLETIKINHGILHNMNLHNERFNRSRRQLFGIDETIRLEDEIRLQANSINGLCKCRLVYGRFIEEIEIIPYQFRRINSLKIIENNDIQYTFKYENRNAINQLFQLKDKCDDILIVNNGMVTDTSYCNIVFSDGKRLLTSSTPLLKGTKRQKLLNEGVITEDEIRLKDIRFFKKVILINAMIDIEDNMEIPTDRIF